jgi:2-keto-4-pentenoate hydratase
LEFGEILPSDREIIGAIGEQRNRKAFYEMTAIDDSRVARGMEALLALRQERLAAGERPIGWKVGYGAPAAREKLGIKAPLVGFLTDGALVEVGSTVSVAGWGEPLAEPEIALYLGRDLQGGSDVEMVRNAIVAVGPAFELVDVGSPSSEVAAILAGNVSHRKVVLGAREMARAGSALEGLSGRVLRNGVEAASTANPQTVNGDMIENVRDIADTLASCGERLRAGDVIITGSIVPALAVSAGDKVVFQLDPIGEISIRFG